MSSLKILITKLSTVARTALEKSANACVLQQNYEIEIEHLFLELLNQPLENDLKILLKKYKISADALADDLKETISQLPKGIPVLQFLPNQSYVYLSKPGCWLQQNKILSFVVVIYWLHY